MQTSFEDVIKRASLQNLRDVGYAQLFLVPGGTMRLYFKNMMVINFIDCVKLTFSECP